MMVSIAIFAIVAVVAIGALLKIVDANKKAQSLETSINNLNFVLDSMTREIRVGSNYYLTSEFDTSGIVPSDRQGLAIYSGPWMIKFISSKTALDNGNHCSGNSCNNPGKNSLGQNICSLAYAYYFDSNSNLNKAEQSSCDDSLTFFPLTSTDPSLDSVINFDLATIKVVTGGTAQPYIQLHLRGSAGVKEKTKSTFDLQTTISQRLPD